MVNVVKIYQNDFDKVYELYKKYYPNVKREDFKSLFVDYWERPEEHYGYGLINENKIVGFISTIFSTRVIENKSYKFCNLSSWLVDEDYRNQSILLIMQILTLKDYTITIYSANEKAIKIFQTLGFKKIANYRKLIFPNIKINPIFTNNYNIIYDEKILTILNEVDKKIYNDHSKFFFNHFVIFSRNEYSYVILKKRVTRLKWLKVAEIHFISNKDMFLKYFEEIKIKIAIKFKIVGIIIKDTYLRGYNFPYSINLSSENMFYRSSLLTPKDIDSLYSEIFLIN